MWESKQAKLALQRAGLQEGGIQPAAFWIGRLTSQLTRLNMQELLVGPPLTKKRLPAEKPWLATMEEIMVAINDDQTNCLGAGWNMFWENVFVLNKDYVVVQNKSGEEYDDAEVEAACDEDFNARCKVSWASLLWLCFDCFIIESCDGGFRRR
jgi:hypothetical protein